MDHLPEAPFGANLDVVLRSACGGRLSTVRWFRTDWQRGGALTGYARYRGDDERVDPVVVKLPVGPGERQWLRRLSGAADVAPRIHADGESLGGYDMAWVVMERLPHGPLGSAWEGREFELLIQAVVRFYGVSSGVPVRGVPPGADWHAVFHQGRKNLQNHAVPLGQRWGGALKKVRRRLDAWLKVWGERPTDQWCHGDLHPANAMTRVPAPGGPAVLLDFALTRPGHWVEDAVYLEHLYWSTPPKAGAPRNICRMIAHERKRRGLVVEQDWPTLAAVRRALLAVHTLASLQREGNAGHLAGALDVLEAQFERAPS